MPNVITPVRRLRRAPYITGQDRAWVFYSSFQLDMEVGVGTLSAPGVDPQITLRWSNDRGHTWSAGLEAPLGPKGAYRTRVMWGRLGRARDRIFEVEITEPVRVAIVDAYLTAETGKR